MKPLLLHDFFLSAAQRYPRRTLASSGDKSLTFAEAADKTKTFARALFAAGVRRSDRVVWRGGTDLDLVPLFFATASLGSIFVPLNPGLHDDETQRALDLCDPRLVIADDNHDGQMQLSELSRASSTSGIDIATVDETDGHIMFFTSGTTGASKAVVLSHRTTVLRALPTLSDFPCGALVSMFPLFHMAAWTSAIGPWLSGDQVVFADGGDTAGLLKAIQDSRASRFYAIPAIWRRILDMDLAEYDLSSLQWSNTGTSPTSTDLLTCIHEALPHTMTSVTYGSTEAGGVCRLAFEDLQRKPSSVGPPLPGVSVRIEDGELWVDSPFLFDGYFKNPSATAAAFADRWYRTGELAEIDEDGFVSILGRRSDMIRSGGEWISPAEVDTVLLEHPAVADGATVGVPDDSWGEIVTAFVVVRPGASLTMEELREHCSRHLARYKVPRRLVVVDEIPRTGATRQVQRRHLLTHATIPTA